MYTKTSRYRLFLPIDGKAYRLAALLFAAVTICVAASADKEFLVMGNPAAASLYNQYEQPLAATLRKGLPAGIPFEIEAKKQLMGDQITPGMRLSYAKETYYLMLDDAGKPAGLPDSASVTFYKGCTVYDDTVTVTAASLTLTPKHPPGRKSVSIKKGSTVVRIFSTRQGTYLFYPSTTTFGWTTASGSAFSRPAVKPSPATAVSFEEFHPRIMNRLAQVNEQYDTVFAFFNNRTGQQRSVPHWKAAVGKQYSYTLDAPAEVVRQFERSTGYVVNDIERLLLGKPFTVSYHDGTITVHSRQMP